MTGTLPILPGTRAVTSNMVWATLKDTTLQENGDSGAVDKAGGKQRKDYIVLRAAFSVERAER
jgi:hypothetical protein